MNKLSNDIDYTEHDLLCSIIKKYNEFIEGYGTLYEAELGYYVGSGLEAVEEYEMEQYDLNKEY